MPGCTPYEASAGAAALAARTIRAEGRPAMLYDHRTYTCRPGTINKHLALYREYGWDAQRRHLGEPVFYAQTETGDVNSYVHIWVYTDAADRARRRAAMQADPDWTRFLEKSAEAGYLVRQETKIMVSVPFFTAHDR